jgi:hypothetical protein
VRSDERGHHGRRCRRTDAPHRFARRGGKGKEETTRVRSRTAPPVTIANDETLRLESPRARPCPRSTLPLLLQPLPSTPDDRSVCIEELRGGGAPCYGKTRSDEPGHSHTKRGGEPARTAPLVLAHRAVHMNVLSSTLEIVWRISLSERPSEAFATRQMETVCTGPCDSGKKANDLPAPRRAPTRSPAGTPACPRRSPSPPRSPRAPPGHRESGARRPTGHTWEIVRNPGRWSGTPRSSQSCTHASVDRRDRHHRPSTLNRAHRLTRRLQAGSMPFQEWDRCRTGWLRACPNGISIPKANAGRAVGLSVDRGSDKGSHSWNPVTA